MADYSDINDNLRRMFYYLMQNQMGEQSLQRQMRYLSESNRMYGERAAENLRAEEAKQKRVLEYGHGLTMKGKEYSLMSDLVKMEPIRQIQARYFMENDPAKKEAIAADLASYGTLVGNMFDLGQNGQPIPAEMYEEASKYLSPDQLQKLFDGTRQRMGQQEQWVDSAASRELRRVQGERTASLQERRLGLETEKFRFQEKTGGASSAQLLRDVNQNLGAIATAENKKQADGLQGLQNDEKMTDNRGNYTPEGKKAVALIQKQTQGWKSIRSRAAVRAYDQITAEEALQKMGYGGGATPTEDVGLDDQTSANLMLEKAKRAFIQRLVTKWNWSPAKAQAKADETFRMF